MTATVLNFKIIGACDENSEKEITQNLESLSGVNDVFVRHKKKKCIIEFNPHEISEQAIENQIKKMGYHFRIMAS